MDIIFTLIVVAFIFGVVVLLPLFIGFLNRHDKRLKLFLLIPVAFIVISLFTAIYPNDEFYEEDFKEVTGLDFPNDGDIIFKSASFPDQHGDYGSAAIIKVSKNFSLKLEEHLRKKGFIENSEPNGSNELSQALKEIGDKKIEKAFSAEADGTDYYVAFLSDEETIVVNRQSY